MLDAKSLATAAAACRSFRDGCQGRYPWRGACCREWGLQEEGGGRGRDGGGSGGGFSKVRAGRIPLLLFLVLLVRSIPRFAAPYPHPSSSSCPWSP